MPAEARAGEGSGERLEPWVLLPWLLLFAEVALAVYLGLRRPGPTPVRVWLLGPPILAAAALLVGLAGAVVSSRHRPFVQRRRVVAFLVLAFVIGTASFPIPFPAHRAGRPSQVDFRLPVRGVWEVAAAGGGGAEIDLFAYARPDRRFGIDLVALESEGGAAAPAERLGLGDHPSFGREVLAPAAGTVVRATGGLPDRPPREWGETESELGNHLVIEVAPGEYLFLAHLERGSLAVGQGDRVERGDVVAAAGSSGSSRFTAEPHLPVHLQDTPQPRWGQGIPMRFSGYELVGPGGAAHPGSGRLQRGQRVRALD